MGCLDNEKKEEIVRITFLFIGLGRKCENEKSIFYYGEKLFHNYFWLSSNIPQKYIIMMIYKFSFFLNQLHEEDKRIFFFLTLFFFYFFIVQGHPSETVSLMSIH